MKRTVVNWRLQHSCTAQQQQRGFRFTGDSNCKEPTTSGVEKNIAIPKAKLIFGPLCHWSNGTSECDGWSDRRLHHSDRFTMRVVPQSREMWNVSKTGSRQKTAPYTIQLLIPGELTWIVFAGTLRLECPFWEPSLLPVVPDKRKLLHNDKIAVPRKGILQNRSTSDR